MSKCNPTFINSADLHYMQGYQQGRIDAIEDILSHIRTLQAVSMPIREMMGICKVGEYIEELKEKADGKMGNKF